MSRIRTNPLAFALLALAFLRSFAQFADRVTTNALLLARPTAAHYEERVYDRMPIMREVQLVGGALIMIFLIVFVLNEIYNSIEIEEGPFQDVADSLESTGVTALVILVLALIVVAASAVMRFFGGSGFATR
ncbi:hypothetical protein [Natrarchaeobaculum aegyptiacum]|uniref:Uncharacterized protein n=1 Tax=Natrarchaeobaculum aegyptiacum TaxID=745377 RepID=A0A2Z2HWF5_9EURY|nr:hypothetical protein [Natrarchaeobaculum aegyptiacum]ARS89927.1 hypothetical protein B1756_09425 [Natrarchaeobaculum aegyptiacum]